MFDRIRRAFGLLTDKFRQFAGITKDTSEKVIDRVELPPLSRVLLRMPWSSMTKKGPGITAAVRRSLASMTPTQRLVCRAKGWDRGMVTADGRLR